MLFEIYINNTDKSFLLLDANASDKTKDAIKKECSLIHSFSSTYQDVDAEYQKFISTYNHPD